MSQAVRLHWSGRHSFSEQGLGADVDSLDWDVGVYMITDARRGENGRIHRGPLYIGKVDSTKFRAELRRHLRGDVGKCVLENCRNSPSFKIASIDLPDEERLTRQLVQDIVALLITNLRMRFESKKRSADLYGSA